MILKNFITAISIVIFFSIIGCQSVSNSKNKTVVSEKELYIPDTVYMVPDNNDYNIDTCEFSFSRMKESPSFALFWAKEYGNDPLLNSDTIKRFNVDELLAEGERIINYFVNDLKFVEKGNSITDKYKVLIYIYGGDGGTAFGGGEDEKIGIFWAPAIRMNKAPFGALAHELGHSFQYLLASDKAIADTANVQGVGSYSFVEMTSQYMLWQVYPEWMTFENYHLIDFMKQTHYAFLHEINMYHSPYVLEYWSNKHGIDFIGKLWWESKGGEDPVMTYKRITGIDQKAFNDEIFDAAQRFITWDMQRIEKVAAKYANQHTCKLNEIENGWFQIDKSRCPQNYGYNGIKLNVPVANTKVNLEFKGLAGCDGFRSVDIDNAGWRYGFLAVKEDGSRVYGKMHSDSENKALFEVPENTAYLWLLVSGAPKEHKVHVIDGNDDNDEQWPFKIKLTGTSLDNSVLQ